MRNLLLPAAGLLLLAACSEPPEPVTPVTLRGVVNAPGGQSGDVYLRLYHAWALEGEMRHPLEFIHEFEADLDTPFEEQFDYPTERGDGLIVYAWLDTDGDAVLCTPSVRDDIAGLTVAEFPADVVEVQVTVAEPCRGPDWFFPAPE